jgi:hypothetical protein
VSRKSILLCFGLFFCSSCRAEQPPCTTQIPVSVLLPDGALVRNLNSTQIVAKSKGNTLPIGGLTTDKEPRHIVIVVETGARVPGAARTIESEILSEVVANSRPDDRFALLTARGPAVEVQLGERRELLRMAIRELSAKPPGTSRSLGLLDALQEAVSWLQPHQHGDAILVLTMGIEDDRSRAKYAKVRDALTEDGIRLFGFQLGSIIGGHVHNELGPLPDGPGVIPSASIVANEEGLDSLSRESGGFIFVEDTINPVQPYKLTDERLRLLRSRGRQIYKAVIEYYLVTATFQQKDFSIDLSDAVRAKLPSAVLAYPRKFPACIPVNHSMLTQ